MASADEWVQHILEKSRVEPIPTDDVMKSLERHVGTNEKALLRIRAVHDHLDQMMIMRRGDPNVRELWLTVGDYLEKYLEATAAA